VNLKDEFKAAVLSLQKNDPLFESLALEIFRYQAEDNAVYKAYLTNLRVNSSQVTRLEKIPCMPVSFFKHHRVVSGSSDIQQHIFESSGTTGSEPSRHFVSDLPFYEFLSLKTFEKTYGPVTDYHILALLPNYLERDNSSLVYMVQGFMYNSFSQESGFFLNNPEELLAKLKRLLSQSHDKRKVLLIGVTFALLDLAELIEGEKIRFKDSDKLVIMETGGMKGRRREMLREEVHDILKNAFQVASVHSEYGMTELISQAYATADGFFEPGTSMRVLIRELNDPFTYLPGFSIGKPSVKKPKHRKTGGINVIDLGNIDSCCFIETQDLGAYSQDYTKFRVLGRFDNSELRGCNLMTMTN
jgi:hypothetical protein